MPELADAMKEALTRVRVDGRRMSQNEFARRVGVSSPTVVRWLGGATPAEEHLPAISRELKIPLKQLQRMRDANENLGRPSHQDRIADLEIDLEMLKNEIGGLRRSHDELRVMVEEVLGKLERL